MLAVMHCKALGVEHVIAKVKNEVTKRNFWKKIWADLVLILARGRSRHVPRQMVLFQHRIEVFQLDEEVVVVEFTVPASWVGKVSETWKSETNINSISSAIEMEKTSPYGASWAQILFWPAEVHVMAVTDNQYLDRIQDLLD